MSVFSITDYRYITRVTDICGGRPIIKGTRVPVQAIVGYYKLGLSVEEILEGLPQLTPAQIYEALSYYHDFAGEIDQEIEDGRMEQVLTHAQLTVSADGRLNPRQHGR